jgi:hypothetical protein
MGGYNQLDFTGLPPGANITKVMAKIVHTETSSQTKLTLSGTTAQGTAFTGQAVPACTAGLMECTTYVDLTSALGSEAKLRSITAGITKGPTLTFGASQPNNTSGSVSLDGVQLIVVYQPGGLGSSSGCINVTPYAANDASTCALLLAQGNKAYISIHGTVYAPGGAFDLKVMNGGTTVFGRGAIIRTLKLFFNPSVTYSGDNITVMNPDENGGRRLPRIVDFWACLPDDAGNPVLPCTDANAEVHTVVKFTDTTNGDGSVSAGTSMTVRSWAHRRS